MPTALDVLKNNFDEQEEGEPRALARGYYVSLEAD